VWVNDTMVAESTSYTFRGTCSTPINNFRLGVQADRFSDARVDEYRYYDDLVVASTYVGP